MTDVGHTGEAVAAKYYQQRGWLLLNHNYRTRLGELDLILYKENTQMIYRKVGEYSYHTIFSHFILMQFRLKKTEEIRLFFFLQCFKNQALQFFCKLRIVSNTLFCGIASLT